MTSNKDNNNRQWADSSHWIISSSSILRLNCYKRSVENIIWLIDYRKNILYNIHLELFFRWASNRVIGITFPWLKYFFLSLFIVWEEGKMFDSPISINRRSQNFNYRNGKIGKYLLIWLNLPLINIWFISLFIVCV